MTERTSSIAGLILAAGKGTRMKSELPKVLHPVGGVAIVERVIAALAAAGAARMCLVLGGELDAFKAMLARHPGLTICLQKHRAGTGDAVASAAPGFRGVAMPSYAGGELLHGEPLEASHVLVSAGDTPCLSPAVLREFVTSCRDAGADLGVLGMDHPTPRGYGRLVMAADQTLERIVEEKDADAATRAITVCNSGIIFARTAFLFELLEELEPNNAQREYYLTDCFAIARRRGRATHVFVTKEYRSFDGVNDRSQLARAEEWVIAQKREELMREGVTLQLPSTIYVEDGVTVGPDTVIGPGTVLRGATRIGRGCQIGANACLTNVTVKDGGRVLDGAVLKDEAR